MKSKRNKLCVVGLGYVGLPLAIKLSKYFDVYGYDIDLKRIKNLKKNIDLNKQFSKQLLNKSKIKYISSYSKIKRGKENFIFIITVPTPVTIKNKPNLQTLKKASLTISRYLRPKDCVIYESTVAPGTTENICSNFLFKKNKLSLSDILLGYSSERLNPGGKHDDISNITKVIASNSKIGLEKVKNIYKKICKKIFIANSIKEAELAKLFENVQRPLFA